MSYEDIELPDLGIEDEFYEDEEEEPFEEDMEEFCSHLEEYRTQAVAILQNREKSIDDRIREYLKFCEKFAECGGKSRGRTVGADGIFSCPYGDVR